MTNRLITNDVFAQWLDDGAELAVVDIRNKEDATGYGQPLFGTNLPADRVLAEIDTVVPRRKVRTVLVDAGDGKGAELAQTLSEKGWSDIHALEGGFPAWAGSDYASTHSFEIPGRTFSLSVRDERGTPVVTVQELKDRREKGEDIIVIDTRTKPEFTRNHVPGAVNIPGAELLLRFTETVPSAETHVVVSCAGLPRAILGAQTLIDAGIPNNVAYLEDGTGAWKRAGWDLEEGLTAYYKPATEASRQFGRDHVKNFSTAGNFPEIDLETARKWAADPDRTTYLLDVRTPEEYEANHIEGSFSSEGGQLLGIATRTIATRGARIVLIDDEDGLRAQTVAHWLSRRNYEIAIVRHAFSGDAASQKDEQEQVVA